MRVIDSHTEGEPTRVVIEGGPALEDKSLEQRVPFLRDHADHVRRTAIGEPRGSDILVGALLCQPCDPNCITGVIFFNNAGYLGMCGHGAIGVIATLAYLGKIQPGQHAVETPVGIVQATLHDAHRVSIENVPSYRLLKGVEVDVPDLGRVKGDVAWGGNWFFLANESPVAVDYRNIDQLCDAARRIRRALVRDGITGAQGAEIDHIEFFGPARSSDANSRNFVYCPGGAYDRSPCGTGTSAKLACLAADGKLAPQQPWIQESIVGSRFEASYEIADQTTSQRQPAFIPTITGNAYICGQTQLISQLGDPFREGIWIDDET